MFRKFELSKTKTITICLVIFAMLFVSTVSALANSDDIRFRSNRFTQKDEDGIELINYNASTDGFTLTAQTDSLALYVDEQSLAIKIRNLITGYVWSSTLDEMEDHRLNETWRNFVNSAVTIDFIVGDGNTTRESLTLNNSAVDFQLITGGFQGDIVFGSSGISLQLVVTIENNDLIVMVSDGSISEPEGVQLIALQLYPFLAATKEDHVPGYMFLPDGAGALIRFDRQEVIMGTPWRGMIYGHDLGITSGLSTWVNDPFVVRMPVYGMVHGVAQNALLTIVESGDMYGEIVAHTAGLSTEFNWVTTLFHYRQFYTQPTTRDADRGPSILLLQSDRNHFDIVMRHRILSNDDADYVGMALAYQERLVQQGVLQVITDLGPMMRLDFLGGETRAGLLWDRVVTMTPVTDIPHMIDRLQGQGLSELMVIYWGWARGGLSNSFPQRSRFERNLGSRTDVEATITELESLGIPMYFHTNYTSVNRGVDRLFGGPRLAEQINSRPHPWHVLVPQDALAQAHNDVSNFASYGIERLALQMTASYVYSTFNSRGAATRSQNRDTVGELIDLLSGGDQERLALFEPIAPFWGSMSSYLNIPMTTSGYLFATDSIPFIHMVLRGHVNYYAPLENFSANSRQSLLRMIDFGAYPSFILTSEPSHLLAETPSRHIFTSEFDVWNQTVVAYYETISAALGLVRGQAIASREVLAPGVVQTIYGNGVAIIVNYTEMDFRFGNVVVGAENFHVGRAD